MKILVACEYSGRVRDAFTALGHDAMSCDILPSDAPGNHYTGDVMDILHDGWDMMVAFPPCTYLAHSGTRWLDTQPERWKHMIDGAVFFRTLLNANIPRVAVENPTMNGWAYKIVGEKATQRIHPYQFGTMEQKGTGLWLRNLPPLVETDNVKSEMLKLPLKERTRVHYSAPGPDRWKERSTTDLNIAKAMADQWGRLDTQQDGQ